MCWLHVVAGKRRPGPSYLLVTGLYVRHRKRHVHRRVRRRSEEEVRCVIDFQRLPVAANNREKPILSTNVQVMVEAAMLAIGRVVDIQ